MATVAFLAGLGAHVTAVLDALERRSIDQRFMLRGSHSPHPGIVIVALDQRSLTELNQRLPIQRRLYAQLLDRLRAARPRLIAIDVQFIGATDSLDDDALIAAITRHGPIVLATHDGPDGPVPVPAGRNDVDGAVAASVGVDGGR